MGRGLIDPATAALVDRQMRNWELARVQRPESRRPKRLAVEDFIAVSRLVGVGDEVPRLLGERLGWPVFGKQILEIMAADDLRMRRVYSSLDERGVGWWEELLSPLIRDGIGRNDYFHKLCKTVLSLARQSPAVFVGRGLDRVLPRDLGLRVQLIAPAEERVRRYAEAHRVDEPTARRQIARITSERAAFIRGHFGIEAVDPLRFDLTLRLDHFGPERAVDAILACRRLRGSST